VNIQFDAEDGEQMYVRISLRQLITNNEHILFALIYTCIKLEAAKDRFLYIFENELLNYQVDLLICYELLLSSICRI